jgi:membrane protease YdiL (CAAX protease family)
MYFLRRVKIEKIKIALQIFILFIFPILLFLFDVIPLFYIFEALLMVSVFAVCIIVLEGWSWRDLGIRIDNCANAFVPYLVLTILVVIGTLVLANALGQKTQIILGNPHFQYDFLLLSFLQEFLFRSFLILKLKSLFRSPFFVIIVNGLLFGFLHVIFPDAILLFFLTFFLGGMFSFVYFYRPNLILATVAHSVINFVAVFYCFASFSQSC